MSIDGRFPAGFHTPIRVVDFLDMSSSQLRRIMMSYGIGTPGTHHTGGIRTGSVLRDFDTGSSELERTRSLVDLLEYLGAYRLAEFLRCRVE